MLLGVLVKLLSYSNKKLIFLSMYSILSTKMPKGRGLIEVGIKTTHDCSICKITFTNFTTLKLHYKIKHSDVLLKKGTGTYNAVIMN